MALRNARTHSEAAATSGVAVGHSAPGSEAVAKPAAVPVPSLRSAATAAKTKAPSRRPSKPLRDLHAYLTMSKEEKGKDLEDRYAEMFDYWLCDEIEEVPEAVSEAFYAYMSDPTYKILHDLRGEPGCEAPSYLYMAAEGFVHDRWLIHFTSQAEALAATGFQQGVTDLTRLGLTRTENLYGTLQSHVEDVSGQGGYNFAYLVSEIEHYEQKKGGQRWAPGVVMCRATGLQVWHDTDEERQVIFMGDEARDLRAIVRDGDAWVSGGATYPTLQEAVRAVVAEGR